MKITTLVVSALLLTTSINFAMADGPGKDKKKDKQSKQVKKNLKKKRMPEVVRKACAAVQLSDEQKLEMRKLRKETRLQVRQIRKQELMPAQKAMRALINDETATVQSAEEASASVQEARGKIQSLRANLRTTALFEIATAEQRPKLAKCMRARQTVRRAKMAERRKKRVLKRLNAQAKVKKEKAQEEG